MFESLLRLLKRAVSALTVFAFKVSVIQEVREEMVEAVMVDPRNRVVLKSVPVESVLKYPILLDSVVRIARPVPDKVDNDK
jgi:hypothetical protein